MDELTKLRDNLLATVTYFEAGNWKEAALSFIEVQKSMVTLSDLFFASPETKSVCDEITALCEKLGKAHTAAAKKMQAFGDGSFLKMIFDSLPAILAFIAALLKKPVTP